MSLRSLVEFFSAGTRLPIDPTDVANKATSLGFHDEINFVGVEMERPQALKGMFRSYVRPTGVYAEPIVCADIYYDRRLTRDWMRLVCCKEVLHVFDNRHQQTHTRDEVAKLIGDISTGILGGSIEGWGLHGLSDKLALFQALAILFPLDAREALLPAFQNKTLTLADLAAAADLPAEFVAVIMHDDWVSVHEMILRTC